MEFAIERRYMEACDLYRKPLNDRTYDVVFYGTLSTANREGFMRTLSTQFKCDYGVRPFNIPDTKWSKWVNGRYNHSPEYYRALCDSKMVFCGLGAGPSCGRTYEAYAAGSIPLIQKYPSEIRQLVPFVDGENCILWEKPSELIKKVENVISNRDYMNELARKCYEFGQTHLLSKHRAQYMLDIIKKHGLL
jgi:hypothetical protein